MGTCQHPCLGHCRETQCPLFIEDELWPQKTSGLHPLEFTKTVARIAARLRLRSSGKSRPLAARVRSPYSSHKGAWAEHGHQQSLNIGAPSGYLWNSMPGKVTSRIRCDFCCGWIDSDDVPITTVARFKRARRTYHEWCFKRVLKKAT